MLEQLIILLNLRLRGLFPDFTLLGLCERIQEQDRDGEIKVFPAEYCSKDQYKHIDFENHKGLIYWRKNGNISHSEIESEVDDDGFEQRVFPLKAVLFAPKDYYKTDNNYTEEKFADNVVKSIVFEANKTLRTSLKAVEADFVVTRYNTDRNEIIREEFEGVAPKIPFDHVIISFDYEITVVGSAACWDYWGCLDEPQEVTFCAPVTLKDSENTTIAQPASGTTYILADSVAKNTSGTTVDTKPYGQELLIGNSLITNSESTLLASLPAETNYEVNDSIVQNTDGDIVAIIPAEDIGIAPDVTVKDQSNNTVATPASGTQYNVLVFSGIQDTGTPPYTNSIIDNS